MNQSLGPECFATAAPQTPPFSMETVAVCDNSSAMTRLLLLLSSCFLFSGFLQAAVKLPALLSDRMVIQRESPVHVWGWADAAEEVSVEFRGQQASSTADAAGHWEVYLKPLAAGGPFEMTVRGSNTITLRDVFVGEVWVASGQSNMVWPLERSNDAEKEIDEAEFPEIRYFKVKLTVADKRHDDVEGEWLAVSPKTAGTFSGVGYFFARHLHEKLGVPFGIIQSAWGGTPAESWTTAETLASDASLKRFNEEWAQVLADYPKAKKTHDEALKRWESEAAKAKAAGLDTPRRPGAPRGPGHHHTPSGLFNAMIAPLTPYAIRGAIWYQGENNAGRGHGEAYRHLFKSMIIDWRREWGQGSFPFLFVQLANYGRVPDNSTWPEVREAQTMALELVNTAMAVTTDIGNPENIHPRNKQDVGMRLALGARAIAYGEDGLTSSGPLFRQATREAGALRLWFDHPGGGLVAQGGELRGFEVAGADGAYVEATARIVGSNVLVWSSQVDAPVKARYAWAAAPDGNLFNKAGLPASPFRTAE